MDLGCATGLSSMHVSRALSGAHVTGCDLSPHMIAVGRHLQRRQVRTMLEVMFGRVKPVRMHRLVTRVSAYRIR